MSADTLTFKSLYLNPNQQSACGELTTIACGQRTTKDIKALYKACGELTTLRQRISYPFKSLLKKKHIENANVLLFTGDKEVTKVNSMWKSYHLNKTCIYCSMWTTYHLVQNNPYNMACGEVTTIACGDLTTITKKHVEKLPR